MVETKNLDGTLLFRESYRNKATLICEVKCRGLNHRAIRKLLRNPEGGT